ncbi:MAG: pyridoxal phosphate-dependent aminotransferase [Coprothermobacterota bacterium]|nr:pyridoxal phosphate-dependent aminotransferase [Coprothermobacterota bacterium]
MKSLSQQAVRMPASGIREIMDLAWKTPGCIHLEVGQPDFPTPAHIAAAGIRAIEEGLTQYTSSRGIPPLREAICRKLREKNGIEASEENLTVCPGAVMALDSSILAVVEPQDEVLLADPGWPNPEMMVELIGATPVHFNLFPERGFLPDTSQIESLVSPRTKAIVLNSPSNPTGAIFPRSLTEEIYRIAQRHDLYIISDEIYEDLVFEGEHFSLARLDRDGRVISVFGVSKSYAMTGWRLGYVFAPKAVSAVITKLQEPFVSCASSISQAAGVAALNGPQEDVIQMREAYRRRRDIAVEVLQRYGLYEYTPGGAFYVMIHVGRLGNDSREIAKRLLAETKVAVAPGSAFGRSLCQYVRVSLANSDDAIREGVERICHFVTSGGNMSTTPSCS